MPTDQQMSLQRSCPHQDWLGINLADYEYYVRRSFVLPGREGFVSEPEPNDLRAHNRPTPALRSSWDIAKAYSEQGYRVVKDITWGVHQLSKAGETFFLLVEYAERSNSVRTTHFRKAFELEPVQPPPPLRSWEDAGEVEIKEELEFTTVTLRVEKKLLKVLKAVAELEEKPLSTLMEHIISQSTKGEECFSEETQASIDSFLRIYKVTDEVSSQRPQGVTEE